LTEQSKSAGGYLCIFPDSSVLSAVVERATITTLTNIEGKSLTEVTVRVRNQQWICILLDLSATFHY
jgi:hypothetical protein